MDTRRQMKIGSVIKEAFTDILLKEGKSIYGQAFVTLTNVKVTSDLTLVRFYLSIFNAPDADLVLQKLNEHKHEIKHLLATKLRHDLRRIPEVEFFRDDTLDYVERIEDVFKRIKEENEAINSANTENKTGVANKKAKKAKD